MENKDLKAAAFPGRTNTMGYTQGLTKLEWITTLIYSNNTESGTKEALEAAKEIIESCAKEQK